MVLQTLKIKLTPEVEVRLKKSIEKLWEIQEELTL